MSDVNISLLGMGVIAVSGFLLLILVMYFIPVRLWIAAWSSGAYVGLSTLVGMRLRRVPPSTIVTARISSAKAGLQISIDDLEAHYLAGGNVERGYQRHGMREQLGGNTEWFSDGSHRWCLDRRRGNIHAEQHRTQCQLCSLCGRDRERQRNAYTDQHRPWQLQPG